MVVGKDPLIKGFQAQSDYGFVLDPNLCFLFRERPIMASANGSTIPGNVR